MGDVVGATVGVVVGLRVGDQGSYIQKTPPLLDDFEITRGGFFGWPTYQLTVTKVDNSPDYRAVPQAKKNWSMSAVI